METPFLTVRRQAERSAAVTSHVSTQMLAVLRSRLHTSLYRSCGRPLGRDPLMRLKIWCAFCLRYSREHGAFIQDPYENILEKKE
ncbi:Hypothetical predicted protein [Octopus vulgaris]|uniref:Uncharacterized protein n=1 Tax=Octopus vulgaris TaxID=6645 RepID=A0AA36B5M6_OCTVU|nr:Hypothetical predicted protein [Octopus vulgaris]